MSLVKHMKKRAGRRRPKAKVITTAEAVHYAFAATPLPGRFEVER